MLMDKIFTKPIEKQFEFDANVASVFDDMASRSIPFYKENLQLIASVLSRLLKEDSLIVDLGCSTANSLLAIHKISKKSLKLLGIDNAQPMIEIAKKKAHAFGADIDFEVADITTHKLPKAHGFIANYTLQFIRPPKRFKLVEDIFNSLEKEGYFVFSEKIIYENRVLDKIMVDHYLDFKKTQGYSDFEISQKREALENVLIPYSECENHEMALKAGFAKVETLFKWGNFATFLAIKS
jgi:tRNA (cmo5U34)-methyltransferase